MTGRTNAVSGGGLMGVECFLVANPTALLVDGVDLTKKDFVIQFSGKYLSDDSVMSIVKAADDGSARFFAISNSQLVNDFSEVDIAYDGLASTIYWENSFHVGMNPNDAYICFYA